MAKIKYASFVAGLAGKSGSSVFFRSSSPAFGYLREFVHPEATTNTALRGSEFKNLSALYRELSPDNKTEFATYAREYRNLPQIGKGDISVRANNGMACMVLMFWNITRQETGFEPATVTWGDITSLLNVTAISAAIALGFLPSVPGGSALSEEFPGI